MKASSMDIFSNQNKTFQNEYLCHLRHENVVISMMWNTVQAPHFNQRFHKSLSNAIFIRDICVYKQFPSQHYPCDKTTILGKIQIQVQNIKY